jgi:hypothetical protein
MKEKRGLVHKVKRLLRRAGLPRWLHRFGPKKYEFWHHALALLARAVFQLSYRRTSWHLRQLGFKVPTYSALAKMVARLPGGLWRRLLAATRGTAQPRVAAMDGTTFARTNPSYHYLKRIDEAGPPGIPVKVSALVDTSTKKVLEARIRIRPRGDIERVPALLTDCRPAILVADKGYDAEWIHRLAIDLGIITMIPARRTTKHGPFRRKMRRLFRLSTYHRRSLVECLFSAVKRKFGSTVRCCRARTIRAEIMWRFIAHNLGRLVDRLFQLSPGGDG